MSPAAGPEPELVKGRHYRVTAVYEGSFYGVEQGRVFLVTPGDGMVHLLARRITLIECEDPGSEREQLGRLVREAWVAWADGYATRHGGCKESWLEPWEVLDEESREADRCIVEAIAAYVRRQPQTVRLPPQTADMGAFLTGFLGGDLTTEPGTAGAEPG
jgi:hypothetical protein